MKEWFQKLFAFVRQKNFSRISLMSASFCQYVEIGQKLVGPQTYFFIFVELGFFFLEFKFIKIKP